MPIDPSIVLGLQPQKPVDYFGAYGNALTLKNLVGQGQMQEMQLAQAQREQQKQGRIADLVRTSGGDMGKFISGMMEIDPLGAHELGMKQRRADAEIAKLGSEGRKLALESADKFKPLYLQAAQFVQSNGYTPESVQQAKRFLSGSGVPADMLAAIPDNPGQQYIDSYIASNMSFGDQLARNKEDFERQYPGEFGKALFAQQRYRDESKRLFDQTLGDDPGGSTPEQIRAPSVNLNSAPTPFDPIIKRLQQGDENAAFLRGPRGEVIANQPAQDFLTSKAKAGATKIDVGLKTYENTLNKNDAEEVSKARTFAETAEKNATEVRTIVDVLRGYKGGQWNVIGAKIGEFLPGTEFAKATNVNQVAESIRARLAPSMRAVGSGTMTEKETTWLMASIPNLLMYEEGRALLATVFERTAERAAIAADIKDQLIRSGTYSVQGYRKAMEQQFGKGGLLKPDELAMVNRVRQSPPPEPGRSAPIPMPKPEFNLDKMPDPAANTGKEIEAQDGTRYKSDGKKWIRQQKGATGRF